MLRKVIRVVCAAAAIAFGAAAQGCSIPLVSSLGLTTTQLVAASLLASAVLAAVLALESHAASESVDMLPLMKFQPAVPQQVARSRASHALNGVKVGQEAGADAVWQAAAAAALIAGTAYGAPGPVVAADPSASFGTGAGAPVARWGGASTPETEDIKYGTVNAPGWVLPAGGVAVVGTALLPVLLRPGEEALEKQREDEEVKLGGRNRFNNKK